MRQNIEKLNKNQILGGKFATLYLHSIPEVLPFFSISKAQTVLVPTVAAGTFLSGRITLVLGLECAK